MVKQIRGFASTCIRPLTQSVRSSADFSGSKLKAYLPSIEAPLSEKWSNAAMVRSSDDVDDRAVFSTILPPPNVTGTLHLGHALTVSIADTVCRWRRMRGEKVLWVPGTDHAGIATQSMVEKDLRTKNLTRHQLGREKFVEEVWKWKNSKGERITDQLRRLGASLDWSKQYFTLDESRSQAVTEALIRLWNAGLVYRAESLVNWCCYLRSAISDIEIEHLSVDGPTQLSLPGHQNPVTFGQLDYFAYRLDNSDEEISIATTRLETMLGDVAVAVHPSDSRYTGFHGKYLIHPLSNDRLPVVVDESVNPEFGTGAVKITPAHDPSDFALSKRHHLPLKTVFSEDGTIAPDCGQFSGMGRFEAREALRVALGSLGLYKKSLPHKTTLPICSRSGDVVEYLLKPQWFINCKGMAEKAAAAVRTGDLIIEPELHHKDWFTYLDNIRDWCISRQLWWGHQVPFYNCSDGHRSIWVAAGNADDAKIKASEELSGSITVERDSDVLDTWFSSGLLPFSSLGWPGQNSDLSKYYPLSTLITGHDILFFWVARMTMLGLELTNQLPFKRVLLHSIVCDMQGRKMSKSLGNIIDPMDIINGCSLKELNSKIRKSFESGSISEKEATNALAENKKQFANGIPECGADALRFSLLTQNISRHFINFNVNECQGNRLFCNKIWQAQRFAEIWAQKLNIAPLVGPASLPETRDLADVWILSKMSAMVASVNSGLEANEFCMCTSAIKTFLYGKLCDVYIEAIKPKLNAGSSEAAISCRILLHCLDVSLRCLAPFMPFVTETLYAQLPCRTYDTINVAAFPADSNFQDEVSASRMDYALEIVRVVRQLKSERGALKLKSKVFVESGNPELLDDAINVIDTLTRSQVFQVSQDSSHRPADALVSKLDLSTTIIVEIETPVNETPKLNLERIQKRRTKLEADLAELQAQMSADDYHKKVSDRAKKNFEKKLVKLKADLDRIASISST